MPLPLAGWRPVYRLVIPAAALVMFVGLAALWHWGPHSIYFDVLNLYAFDAFRFPFLDIQVVLAAAECWRHGFDVYLLNPCDALGRPLAYSPLWLRIIPHFLNTSATAVVGAGLGLMFIGSLAAVCRPSTRGEVLVLGLTALSPMVVYALERANADVAIYLLVLTGCAVGRTRGRWRFGAYGLYLFAGLLKYYPLVLLLLIARERRRDAFAIGAVMGLFLALLAVFNHFEIGKALANIPDLSYFGGLFAAENLPFGVAEILGGSPVHRRPVGIILFAVLLGLMVARTRRTLALLDRTPPDWAPFEAQCLTVGALVLVGCFFAGQNIDYRGIFFVLVMPGLLLLRRSSREIEVRRFLGWMITAVLFVVWDPVWREAVRFAASAIPSQELRLRTELLFWLGRELVWWWLITGLIAVLLVPLRRMPLLGRYGRATDASPSAPPPDARPTPAGLQVESVSAHLS